MPAVGPASVGWCEENVCVQCSVGWHLAKLRSPFLPTRMGPELSEKEEEYFQVSGTQLPRGSVWKCSGRGGPGPCSAGLLGVGVPALFVLPSEGGRR